MYFAVIVSGIEFFVVCSNECHPSDDYEVAILVHCCHLQTFEPFKEMMANVPSKINN